MFDVVMQVYFHVIPEEVIHSLIEEGITLNVAGGLMLEHPLISPFVEAVVSSLSSLHFMSTLAIHLMHLYRVFLPSLSLSPSFYRFFQPCSLR